MINERAERREQWLLVLDGCVKHHYNLAMKTAPVIIGEEPSEEHITHKVWAMAINDAIGLIELLPVIEGDEDGLDDTLPQHRTGPAG